MKLKNKLILSFILISLITAATAGCYAYWSLMRDFSQTSKERAFENFTGDLTAYLQKYGTLENGEQSEPFHQFVHARHLTVHPINDLDKPPQLRPMMAPFHFMILTPTGLVKRNGGDYAIGEQVPPNILNASQPIEINGRVMLRVIQTGDPILTDIDLQYLAIIRKALITGFLVSSAFALLCGLIFSRKISAPLQRLTDAIANMSLTGEPQTAIPIRFNDEVGLLTAAFNRVSQSLQQTHSELQQSHDQIKEQAGRLHDLSIRDPLTNLFNRRHFDQQIAAALSNAIKQKRSLTIVMADIDHFKDINDHFSHATGDEVLKQVSTILSLNTRSSDMVARYGGEEFVIAFFDSTLEQSAQFCEKIRRLIEEHPWQDIHPELRVTISMGLSSDVSLDNLEKIIAQADEQLYAAKKEGRNRVMPSELTMQEAT